MPYRIVMAVASDKGPIYNGRHVEAAEVVLDDERYELVDESRVLSGADRREVDDFLRRRAGATIHAFGGAPRRVMVSTPWNIPPEAWGECIHCSVVALMNDMGEGPALAEAVKSLEDAARYFGVPRGDGSALATARASAKVYAEVLRMRREDEFLHGEARMIMNDGW